MGRMEAGGAVAPGGSSNLVEVSAVAVPQDEVNAAQALMHAPNVPMPTKMDPLHKGPKEPKTPYNFYCEVRRPHIVAAHPEAGAPNISRLLGEEWQKIDTKDRAQWDSLANADRERYLRECASLGIEPNRCKRKIPGVGVSVSGRLQATVVPGSLRPSAAMTAVDFFLTAREGRYVCDGEAGASSASALFASLPEAERAGYEAAAHADALRFARETASAEEAQRAAEQACGIAHVYPVNAEATALMLDDQEGVVHASQQGYGGGGGGGGDVVDGSLMMEADEMVDGYHHQGSGGENGGAATGAVLPEVVATEVMPRAPYKKFKPKTRKPQGVSHGRPHGTHSTSHTAPPAQLPSPNLASSSDDTPPIPLSLSSLPTDGEDRPRRDRPHTAWRPPDGGECRRLDDTIAWSGRWHTCGRLAYGALPPLSGGTAHDDGDGRQEEVSGAVLAAVL